MTLKVRAATDLNLDQGVNAMDQMLHISGHVARMIDQQDAGMIRYEQAFSIAEALLELTCKALFDAEVLAGIPRWKPDPVACPTTFFVRVSTNMLGFTDLDLQTTRHIATTGEECSICHDAFRPTDRIVRADACYHRWHAACITECIENMRNDECTDRPCPNCRTDLIRPSF